uniref:Uncharacterized protein n=1 Tax=Timema bartmani TaxID=61472 RepID=A0A7R9FCC8_9NEOP|nr:unnamed protein product [Timema bartmani]
MSIKRSVSSTLEEINKFVMKEIVYVLVIFEVIFASNARSRSNCILSIEDNPLCAIHSRGNSKFFKSSSELNWYNCQYDTVRLWDHRQDIQQTGVSLHSLIQVESLDTGEC